MEQKTISSVPKSHNSQKSDKMREAQKRSLGMEVTMMPKSVLSRNTTVRDKYPENTVYDV